MGINAKENTTSPNDGDTVEVLNPDGGGTFLLVCEHASSAIPAEFDGLGLSEDVQTSHAGWDIGALEVARHMSSILNAPLVSQLVSRLVYDCNRPPSVLSATPSRSEIYDIPGNKDLSEEDRLDRAERFYRPFNDTVSDQMDALVARGGGTPVLITVHSFTPTYYGKQRDVEVGILHDGDRRLAGIMLGALRAHTQLKVEENQPYGPEDGVTHTLSTHGVSRNVLNVMIEIRNDLIANAEGQQKIAQVLADAVLDAQHLFTLRVG